MKAAKTLPAQRPLRTRSDRELATEFERALAAGDGVAGAHCVHERWMRGEFATHIETALDLLWKRAAESIPDWLPMRYVSWLLFRSSFTRPPMRISATRASAMTSLVMGRSAYANCGACGFSRLPEADVTNASSLSICGGFVTCASKPDARAFLRSSASP